MKITTLIAVSLLACEPSPCAQDRGGKLELTAFNVMAKPAQLIPRWGKIERQRPDRREAQASFTDADLQGHQGRHEGGWQDGHEGVRRQAE